MVVQTYSENRLSIGSEAIASGAGAAVGEMMLPTYGNPMIRPALIGATAAAGGMLSNQVFDEQQDNKTTKVDFSDALKTAAGTFGLYFMFADRVQTMGGGAMTKEITAFILGALGNTLGQLLPDVPLIGSLFTTEDKSKKPKKN